MDLTSPKNCLRLIWNKLISPLYVEGFEQPNDLADYGLFPHCVSCSTGYHPAVILALEKRAGQFNRVFETHYDLRDYVVPIVENMSASTYREMLAANLLPPNNPPVPQ